MTSRYVITCDRCDRPIKSGETFYSLAAVEKSESFDDDGSRCVASSGLVESVDVCAECWPHARVAFLAKDKVP